MILGHQKQKQFLKKMIESEKIPHALLFSGQEKLGKKTLALELISSLFRETPTRILGGGHPDFILIESQGGQIQIDQIRELSWKLSLKPIKAPLLSAIINRAHLMTKEAQNCFLKTLEEPRGNALLILITEYPNFLLPTIISRCQIIKFQPLKKEEIKNYLKEKGAPEEAVKEIAGISLGKPGVAIEFLENPEKLKERKTKIKELIKISEIDLAGRFQYAKDLFEEDNLKDVLDIWLNHFRNILIERCLTLNVEQPDYSITKLKNILQQIQKTIFLISTTNVNQRLALEILMMEF